MHVNWHTIPTYTGYACMVRVSATERRARYARRIYRIIDNSAYIRNSTFKRYSTLAFLRRYVLRSAHEHTLERLEGCVLSSDVLYILVDVELELECRPHASTTVE